MTRDELRAAQAPLKDRYQQNPAAAQVILTAEGALDVPAQICRVQTPAGTVAAGLHPASGGDGQAACSGEMLLQALAACAGVTLGAVATAMGIAVRRGSVRAEGTLDFRGTLGVARDVPIGFAQVRLHFDLETDATPEAQARLIELTERYCVVLQTLRHPPNVTTDRG
jgi:uncharacterized OsmC-like protein